MKSVIKNWDIRAIEAIEEKEAAAMAIEKTEIKGHDVYFVDFAGYFGFSALVFLNGGHIYHANDYELHHNGKPREWLKDWYIKTLNEKLFTVDELKRGYSDYTEKGKMSYYIMNYYGMQEKYVSAFRIIHNDAEEKAYNDEIEGMIYNPICFAYYPKGKKEFVENHIKLYNDFVKAGNEKEKPLEYWTSAFLHEMKEHEYAINWQADYDVVSCFADVSGVRDYESREALFAAANFTDTQKEAYAAALNEYYKNHADF